MPQIVVDNATSILWDRDISLDRTVSTDKSLKWYRRGAEPHILEVELEILSQTDHIALRNSLYQNLVGPYAIRMPSSIVYHTGTYDSATSTPLVNGEDQTGTTLNIDGILAGAGNVFRAGDIIKIEGVNLTYYIQEEVDANAEGEITVTLNQPLVSSPDDNAAITVGSDVIFSMHLLEYGSPIFKNSLAATLHATYTKFIYAEEV